MIRILKFKIIQLDRKNKNPSINELNKGNISNTNSFWI